MALHPLRPGTGRYKPPLGAQINRQHPLARGLEVAVLAAEGAGAVTRVLTRQLGDGAARGVLSGSIGWRPGRDGGPAVDIQGTNGVITVAGLSDTPFLGALTLVWRGVVDAGGTYRHFMGKHTGNGGSANPFDFRTDSGGTTISWYRGSGSPNQEQYTGGTFTTGAAHTLATSATSGLLQDPVYNYVDGVQFAVSRLNGSSGSPTGGGADLVLGRRPDGAVQMDGGLELALLYSRALTAAEHAWLAREPYAPFTAGPRAWFDVPVGGGGGASTARSFVVIAA